MRRDQKSPNVPVGPQDVEMLKEETSSAYKVTARLSNSHPIANDGNTRKTPLPIDAS